MDIRKYWTRHERRNGLLGIEKISLIYLFFTTVLLLILWGQMEHPLQMLTDRLLIIVGMAIIIGLYKLRSCRITFFLRIAYPMALLAYWYPETYSFCSVFPYLDHLFAGMDQELFGGQPALVFCHWLDNKFWSEAFNLGYFSYYPLIFIVVIYAFLADYRRFEKTTFIIVASFLLYYAIYIFFPVAGPQYYYPAAGIDNITNGTFPSVGTWFRTHTEMLPPPQHGGLFQWLVEQAQASGERPTAAFPSSHVGMSTILLILAGKMNRNLVLCILPFYVLLCGATVYIQAHYLVDVIAGLITAGVFYKITHWLYYRKYFHRANGVSI